LLRPRWKHSLSCRPPFERHHPSTLGAQRGPLPRHWLKQVVRSRSRLPAREGKKSAPSASGMHIDARDSQKSCARMFPGERGVFATHTTAASWSKRRGKEQGSWDLGSVDQQGLTSLSVATARLSRSLHLSHQLAQRVWTIPDVECLLRSASSRRLAGIPERLPLPPLLVRPLMVTSQYLHPSFFPPPPAWGCESPMVWGSAQVPKIARFPLGSPS